MKHKLYEQLTSEQLHISKIVYAVRDVREVYSPNH